MQRIGDKMKMMDLIKDSDVYEGMDEDRIREDLMKIDFEIHDVAERNGYRFNSHHHDNEFLGMPWVYDFYIEIGDAEKDIERINDVFQYRMKIAVIEKGYGSYDEEKDMRIGLRTVIPWQIKKIYDEINMEIQRPEADGTIIE